MSDDRDLAQQILDNALLLAESRSWEGLRLHHVAEVMDIPLAEVHRHYREKEDLTDAWFDRADAAMLREASAPDFPLLPVRARIFRLIIAWLDALAPHRRVTRQMILGKLEPGHLHIQIPAVMRISRTVQWVREAARMNATYVQRAFEETTLTSIYLATFSYWMTDDSRGSVRTRQFLDSTLGGAETLSQWLTLGYAWSTTEPLPRPPPAPRPEPIAPAPF
jgi:ubiquinone biosynthesis protein COQ9